MLGYKNGQLSKTQRNGLSPLIANKHQWFFHCTAKDYLQSIIKKGINPSGGMLDYGEPEAVRLCSAKQLTSVMNMKAASFYDKFKRETTVIALAIPAVLILKRSYELDWSAGQTAQYASTYGIKMFSDASSETIMHLFERVGFISCYETIPAKEIEYTIYPGAH